MGSFSTSLLVVVLLLAVSHFLGPSTVAAENERKLHIIYMGSHMPSTRLSPKFYYDKLMRLVIGSEYSKNASEYLHHWYHRSFYGCAAKLTDAEAQKISGMVGVVSVFPSTKLELHTTRSWDFMGFPVDVPRSIIEKDVIVGVIDSGIWPESPSFRDTGLGPIPAKWKGVCQQASNFSCNKKIIGARYYRADKKYPKKEGPTPRDYTGHGTHTASTVAGGLVANASLFGYANGTARGGVPGARIAVYKVCWSDDNCNSADLLRAFDDAIADGVDIISVSIGSTSASQYFLDTRAIGSFHAMQRGILSSFSAGNNGPALGAVTNVASWLLSVAASSIDRKFLTGVQLGNGKFFQGRNSINPFNLKEKKLPVIYGGNAPNSSLPNGARICSSLNRTLVQGKIVLCDLNVADVASQASLDAGAAGTLIRDVINDDRSGSEAYPLPTALVRLDDGDAILSYIRNNPSSKAPVATILKTHTVKDKLAPYIGSFSSGGPNMITPGILKPDLSAPGVDILAAYSPMATPAEHIAGDKRSVLYNILFGTSMACPHASAAAAYVKSYHPDWSPAAIRSALMTTAFPLSPSINEEAELAYGAGHINPLGAVDPGLVYDAGEADYVNLLCGQGFSVTQISQISGDRRTTCSKNVGFVRDLNYPSITIATNSLGFNNIFRRRVTNVVSNRQHYPSTYEVKVTAPRGLSVEVKPKTLRFTHPRQELAFTVQVRGRFASSSEIISASIEWFDGVHKVRSPIVAFQPRHGTRN